ncbi:iron chelate uptake ABC transporter family permease subunit [Amycolatopsis rhizosphaerae]|uniref:Iron chelate uptake ABC transporter family permease subunit n=1 Tax=Amycolatopsis rhizosphaerae TaxID=2053003 RepID=A0A558CPM0_9PSEU|nr:iron chelate uptake ABC transporter family permease subunit [Amycolatopsis rhizosphaerae]TVT50697.1 iron chelate uptake ABC transporter family permease subunit [Amycolatopsis rhizosphaerae]
MTRTVTVAVSHRRRRRLTGLAALVALLLVICAASVAIGAKSLPPGEVWTALRHPTGTEADLIVRSLRLPRTVLGLLAGLALGAAGALMQGHTRNPLADPGLLGVTHGAAFAVVFAVVVLHVTGLYGFIWFGFAGALLASVAVFLLGAVGGRGATPVTLALAGAAVSALLQGFISAIVLGDERGMDVYRFWRIGSIAGRDYAVVGQIAPFLVLGLLLALAGTTGLNTLALGEDVARTLGQRVLLTRTLGVLAITLLTGSAVAACGPIAFLGLVVPHLARAITGPDYRWLVPFSALLGAILLLAADVAGRALTGDSFEVGILLALAGAPVFILLVRGKGLSKL